MPVPLGPQNYDDVMRMREKLFIDELRRQEMMKNMLDPLSEGNAYDDTKTPGQDWRDAQQRTQDRLSLRGVEVIPRQYGKPGNVFDNIPMPRGFGVGRMGEAYNAMPDPSAPKYPMQEYPLPIPSNPETMQQLMQFYGGEYE